MENINIERKGNNKKWDIKKKTIIAIVIIFLLLILLVVGIVWNKFSKLNIQSIDKTDLDVNDDLYDEISSSISEAEFNQVINIVLFGSDSRDTEDAYSGRSDSIIIVSINSNTKRISLVSIPRDTYVNVPGYGYTKINHAYAYGGEQLAIKTINSNFGLNLTEYITIDFSGIINVINAVGGIEVTITEEEMEVLNSYLQASYELSGKIYVPMTEYGTVTLNGEQALAHARDRYVGNDFDRANRQRTIIIALLKKMSSMSTEAITALVSDDFLSQVTTNINIAGYADIMTTLLKDRSEYLQNITSVQVPSTDIGSDSYIDGIYYFVADMNAAKQEMLRYLYGVEN